MVKCNFSLLENNRISLIEILYKTFEICIIRDEPLKYPFIFLLMLNIDSKLMICLSKSFYYIKEESTFTKAYC